MKRAKPRQARFIEPMLTGIAMAIGVNAVGAEIAVDAVNIGHRPLSGKTAPDFGKVLQSNPMEGLR